MHAAPETRAADVVAACNSVGLFGGDDGGRLVIVEDVDGRRGSEGRLVSGWKAAEVKELVAYAESPAPGTVLALVAHELKPDSPLGKACAKTGQVLAFDVAKRDLPKWVVEQFRIRGADVDGETARRLVELVGESADELSTEVDKLVTWAGGEAITADAVDDLTAGRAETAGFALTDAWGRRDTAATLAAAERLLEQSARPRSSELPRLVGQLVAYVGRVRACQALAEEGLRAKDAAERLKLHRFVAEKAFGHSRNYTRDELGDAVVRLAALDHAVKGGSRLASDLELERALVDVTKPA